VQPITSDTGKLALARPLRKIEDVHRLTRATAHGARTLSNSPSAQRLVGASAATSVLLLFVLAGAYVAFHSQLALAQAADSCADVLTACALVWAIQLSRQPPDDDHPFGHQGAQPIAALVVAVLACVLSVEVLREAITTLLSGETATVTPTLLAALAGKAVIKAVFVVLAMRALHKQRTSALTAFYVDARNDVLVGATSVLGLALSKTIAVPTLDAWLAIPVALWVAWSGVSLGLENARLLMGAMPPSARIDVLRELAGAMPGVHHVAALQARHHGDEIHLWIEIRVDPKLTVREAHDIGKAVEDRLVEEQDVCRADVHVDAVEAILA
jgi:cation diffusion facilitator family transporter